MPELPRAEVLSTPTCNQICASLSCFHCFFPRSPLVSPYLPFPLFLAPTTTDRVDREAARLSSLGSLRGPSPISLPRTISAACCASFRSCRDFDLVIACFLGLRQLLVQPLQSHDFQSSREPSTYRQAFCVPRRPRPASCLPRQTVSAPRRPIEFRPQIQALASASELHSAVLLRIRFCLPPPIASFVRHLSACPVLSRALSPPSIAMS